VEDKILRLMKSNGTFSTNRLYRAFEKYVAVKTVVTQKDD